MEDCATTQSQPDTTPRAPQPGLLYLVTAQELEELRTALAKGGLPLDLETKLNRLAQGDLLERSVARHCGCFVALLQSVQEGAFREATPEACERLLQVLAYVRKDEDAIADYKPGGFKDDQQEVRAATLELGPLLKSFKAWRLRFQVAGMWLS